MFEDEASIARTDIDEDAVVGMDKVGELADVYFCLARTDEDSHVMASRRCIGADCASRCGTGHQIDNGVPKVDALLIWRPRINRAGPHVAERQRPPTDEATHLL